MLITFDGDPEIEKQIIDLFVSNLKSDVTALHKSLKDENYESWDIWVHKLYGSSSQAGASAFAKACDEGQMLDSGDIEKIREVHRNILVEYKRLHAYLENRQQAY